jgi:Regulator of chromosome condensation (RCC1) repeat
LSKCKGLVRDCIRVFIFASLVLLCAHPVVGADNMVAPKAPALFTVGYYQCARLEDGEIFCWGPRSCSEFRLKIAGLGDAKKDIYPKRRPQVDSPLMFSGDNNYILTSFCTLTRKSEVKCTIEKSDGGERSVFDFTAVESGAASITGGAYLSCALMKDRSVVCWGRNGIGNFDEYRTLVLKDRENLGMEHRVRIAVAKGIDDAVQVSASTNGHHVCAVVAGGSVKCWGEGSFGKIGNGKTDEHGGIYYSPVAVKGISDAVSVSAGNNHSCAVLSDGRVMCWGENKDGQLGNGRKINSNVPVKVVGIYNALDVSSGYDHTCAVLKNGQVKCWGDGMMLVGMGPFAPLMTIPSIMGLPDAVAPVTVFGVNRAVAVISSQRQNDCAVMSSGLVKCWSNSGDSLHWFDYPSIVRGFIPCQITRIGPLDQ